MDTEKLTLTLPADIKTMIKRDAKALGMNPSGYVSMVCRTVNEEARSEGMQEMIHQMCQTVTDAVTEEMKAKAGE